MGKKSQILIVDDEILFSKLLKLHLEENPEYEIYLANNGKTAIEFVKQNKPDLVLLDIIMPDMNGLECLRQIKALSPNLPVTMITAVYDEETGRRAFHAGAYDYITKPVDAEYLKMALQVKLCQ
ncbi:MAG TPA: response regulator [Nitrospiria bacterium]|nr:response regulator [Nitrospiria bacterium]